MSFNDRDYTKDSIIKQLGLIELHSKDGSAVESGCQCIESKHLFLLEGLAEEGVGFGLSQKEKDFYQQLGDLARRIRKQLEIEDYSLHGLMRATMKTKHPQPLGNPRRYLPYALTSCEKRYPSVQKRLSSCIKQTEKKEGAWTKFNPIAVCRASVKCPP